MQNGSDSPFTSFLKTNECKNQSQISLSQFIKHLVRNKKKKQIRCEREKGGRGRRREKLTELGLRRERQRGQRAEPTPGFRVGSKWRFPFLSFSSYTSLVPILFRDGVGVAGTSRFTY